MSDETTPAETWTAVGATLVHADRIVGSLSTPELAEWVAEACETLAEMDKARAEWETSGEAPHCAVVDIGGEEMRLQHGAEMPEMLRDAMADVVDAARRAMVKAKAHERFEHERQVREEITARVRTIHHPKTAIQITPCADHRFPSRAEPDCPNCERTPITVCSNLTCCEWPCPTAIALDPPEGS